MEQEKEVVAETPVEISAKQQPKPKVVDVMYYQDDIRIPLEKAISLNLPALLVGETGTGKTSFIRDLAKKHKRQLIRINLTGQTGVDELIGKILAKDNGTYWVDGLLTIAMKKGYWIVLDEVNMALPEILSKLHSLLDDDRKIILNEHKGEVIRPHKNFRLFGTMNPSDEYAGTKELNKAFISRFSVVIETEYSDNEVQILMDRTGIDPVTADNLVAIASDLRVQKQKEVITYPCSTRDLIYACQLIVSGVNTELALETAVVNKAQKDERSAIKTVIELITKQKFSIKSHNFTSIKDIIQGYQKLEDDNKKLVETNRTTTTQITKLQDENDELRRDLQEANKNLDDYKVKFEGIKKKLMSFVD